MKTLIINGSPHVHGDTAALLEHFLAHLYGDYFMVWCAPILRQFHRAWTAGTAGPNRAV